MTANTASVTILDEAACWEALGWQDVGRLGVAIMNRPDIFPVNYVVAERTIVFRTAEGTKLAAAVLGTAVAFEADGTVDGDAWSVVAKGRAEEIQAPDELFAALDLPLHPWLATTKQRFVRVVPEEVTGRRFVVTPQMDTWGVQY